MDQNEILVAHCGLVCSDCGAFKKGKCPGCLSEKPLNRNCKIKACNYENGYRTCADCREFERFEDCGKLNNFISKIFKLVFRSDRMGQLYNIRESGLKSLGGESESKRSSDF